MTNTTINHRSVALATAACVGTLLAVTVNSAHAIPEPVHAPIVDQTVDTDDHFVERACFITPLTWNEALDGPLPRCRTYVSR